VNIIPNSAAVQLPVSAAEAIRSLDYATVPNGDVLTYASDVAAVIGGLEILARRGCSAGVADLVPGGEH